MIMTDDQMTYLIGGIVIITMILMTRKWFWLILFSLGALASLFTCIASIIHFQILAAVGFFILAVILYLSMGKIASM
jgi:hypothetical protein